jgi:hypothetical protein
MSSIPPLNHFCIDIELIQCRSLTNPFAVKIEDNPWINRAVTRGLDYPAQRYSKRMRIAYQKSDHVQYPYFV